MERQVSGWLLALTTWFVGPALSIAHASVNLPLHHWAYDAIERLTALGVIERAMVVTKPYSRKQAAKYVAQALDRIRADHVPVDGQQAVAEPLLERLIEFLEPELVELGAIRPAAHGMQNPKETQRRAVRVGSRLQVEGDAFSIGRGSVRLRENRMGQFYANGEQVQTDLRGWVELSDVLAFSIDPKYISNVHALGLGATENTRNAYLQEFNAKLTLFNLAFQVGRGTNWWGPGYHGSLLLTDHAFPLDMVQLGSDEPFRLPWRFGTLGEWKIHTFYAQLERDREFPRSKVFGLRLSYLPASWLELGANRLTQFDGRNNPRGQSFPQTVVEAYLRQPNQTDALEVNEQVSLDFRATVPRLPYLVPFPSGLQLYGEVGSEDKWSKVLLPSRAAVLGGLYIPQVLPGDTLDLRIEYADTDLTRRKTRDHLSGVWYNNGIYRSGMRHRGFPLGHHMGTDGVDIFVRSTRYLSENLQLGATFNLQWRGRGQPVSEKKREAAFDLTWWLSSRMQLTVAYTFQRIEHPGQIVSINPFVETFHSGVTSTNHLLWTNFAVEF